MDIEFVYLFFYYCMNGTFMLADMHNSVMHMHVSQYNP